ncbi:MAG: hypothetical protein AAF943_15025 [Pseudomonadota bacterium]
MTEEKKSEGGAFSALKSALSGVGNVIPAWSWPSLPTLGRKVTIPVYLIHNSDADEDYFFIFDFEEFVERSRQGVFVRPVLKVWAGRDDFDRKAFARQFRESFTKEFDHARAALSAQEATGGWFSWLNSWQVSVETRVAAFVANIVLLVALSAGRLVLSQILPTRLWQGKSDAEKLEESIEETKRQVDAALAGLNVVLHEDLTRHAFYGRLPEAYVNAGFDAWPLPDFVEAHVHAG